MSHYSFPRPESADELARQMSADGWRLRGRFASPDYGHELRLWTLGLRDTTTVFVTCGERALGYLRAPAGQPVDLSLAGIAEAA